MRKHLLLTTALCVVPVASAQAVGLMVGSGDGALSVQVDEFGAFDEAIYDPIGPFEADNTTASSFIAIGSVDSGFERLGDIASEPAITTSGDDTSTTSVFSAQGLDFELRQSVSQDFVQGDVTGATLTQIPLSVVILGSVVVGAIVGFLLEWLREAKHRRLAAEKKREVGRLRAEINRLTSQIGEGGSDLPELPAR